MNSFIGLHSAKRDYTTTTVTALQKPETFHSVLGKHRSSGNSSVSSWTWKTGQEFWWQKIQSWEGQCFLPVTLHETLLWCGDPGWTPGTHSSAGERSKNAAKGSWAETKSWRGITHQLPSWVKQPQLGEIILVYYQSKFSPEMEKLPATSHRSYPYSSPISNPFHTNAVQLWTLAIDRDRGHEIHVGKQEKRPLLMISAAFTSVFS